MSYVAPPRGHRYHQLRVAMELLARHGAAGRLVDVGTGAGWVPDGWRDGPAVGLDRFPAPSWKAGARIVADTAALPVRGGTAATCTAIAALGAFEPRQLAGVVGELARTLAPGGVLVVLVSHRSAVYDRLTVHRVLSGYRWSSFTTAELRAAVEAADLEVTHVERRGGPSTLVAEWLHFLTRPLQRRASGERIHRAAGELDGRSFRRAADRGRYLYLVARRR